MEASCRRHCSLYLTQNRGLALVLKGMGIIGKHRNCGRYGGIATILRNRRRERFALNGEPGVASLPGFGHECGSACSVCFLIISDGFFGWCVLLVDGLVFPPSKLNLKTAFTHSDLA